MRTWNGDCSRRGWHRVQAWDERDETMKKFLKIAAVVVLLLFVAAAGVALYAWRGMRAVPAFYESEPLAGAERLEAIESVERKVLNLQGVLDRAYARATAGKAPETASSGSATRPAGPPDPDPLFGESADQEPISVSFTGPELDTYFNKWLEESGYGPRLEQYMTNPRIAVQDGRVILAGRMADFNAVVSLHFLPIADPDGTVHLRLDGIYAGRLPLPEMAFEEFRDRTVAALAENMPQMRRGADISAEGFANEDAIFLASQAQLIELLEGREVETMRTFLPLPGRGWIPARVSELEVADHELTLAVELLTPEERQALLRELRSGAR